MLKYFLLLTCIIPLIAACPKHQINDKSKPDALARPGSSAIANPAAVLVQRESALYKKLNGTGFKYEIRNGDEGQRGVVIFPDSSECDEWRFYSGECGQKWSFCEQSGYRLVSAIDTSGGFSSSRGVCVFPDSTSCPEWEFVSGACEPR